MKKTALMSIAFLTAAFAPPSVCPAINDHWIESWYSAPIALTPHHFSDSTLRTVVHLTTGGEQLRLRLSNQYGRKPLGIGCARVELNGIFKMVTFGGKPSAFIPPGTTKISDPVTIATMDGSELIVSVFYPGPIPEEITTHPSLDSPGSVTLTTGNTVSRADSVAEAIFLPQTYFLVGVEVTQRTARGTIVAIGDSITDGGARRWPALLAERLSHAGKHYGMANAGIGGNRVLRDDHDPNFFMPSAISRFDRDVLSQPGVEYVILYEGINDIGNADGEKDQPGVSEITSGISLLARRVHSAGLKLFVATLPPYEGAWTPYYSREKNELRKGANAWIRTSSEIDGYFDFERAIADPENPNRLLPEFDSGDHLHPNEAGEIALSESVDLSIFK